jgi:hypothetical protein
MSRLAERNARKTGSVTSGSRQSRQAGAEVRAGGRTSTHTGRSHLDAAGTGSSYGMNAERHDWLVPLELP